MESGKNSAFLPYLHNFRGFAILLIVAVHSIYMISDTLTASYRISAVLFENSTILFLFIGGFLLQYLGDSYSYKSYLTKKFKYVILPYLIMSVPSIILIYARPGWQGENWLVTEHFLGLPKFVQIILFYVTGAHLSPFWYIPMIAILYLLFPVFDFMDKKARLYWIIPALIIVSMIIGRPKLNDNTIQSFIYFLPVYLLGMFTSHYFDRIIRLAGKYWIYLTLTVILLTIACFYDHRFSFLQKIALSYLVLLLLYLKKPLPVFDFSFGLLAKLSFGIYFIHKYVIYLVRYAFNKFDLNSFFTSGLVNFAFFILIIIITCILLLTIVNLTMRDKSRMFVGA